MGGRAGGQVRGEGRGGGGGGLGAATLAGALFSCLKANTGVGVGSFGRLGRRVLETQHKCGPGRSRPRGRALF